MTALAINKKATSSGKASHAHDKVASAAATPIATNVELLASDEPAIDPCVEIEEPGPIEQFLDKKLSVHQLHDIRLTDTPVFSDVIRAYAS